MEDNTNTLQEGLDNPPKVDTSLKGFLNNPSKPDEKSNDITKVDNSLSGYIESQKVTTEEDKPKKTKTPIKKTNNSQFHSGNLSSYNVRLADNSGSGQSSRTSSYSSATLAGIKEKTTHLVDVFSRNVSDHYRQYNPEPPVQETLEAKTVDETINQLDELEKKQSEEIKKASDALTPLTEHESALDMLNVNVKKEANTELDKYKQEFDKNPTPSNKLKYEMALRINKAGKTGDSEYIYKAIMKDINDLEAQKEQLKVRDRTDAMRSEERL